MFTLPKLDYAFDALEPHIDARTMEIHYSRHHQGYTNNLNTAIEDTDAEGKSIEEILHDASKYPAAVINNGGGFYNHNLFWKNLSPNGGGKPDGKLAVAINHAFGSFEAFQQEFNKAAATRFGSGWAWLIQKEDGSLLVSSTPNQDSPIMDFAEHNGKVLLALDVWEHAYYLHYQNKRPDYIQAFWNVVDWNEVNNRFSE